MLILFGISSFLSEKAPAANHWLPTEEVSEHSTRRDSPSDIFQFEFLMPSSVLLQILDTSRESNREK